MDFRFSQKQINNIVIKAYDSIASSYTNAYAENDDLDSKYLDEFISITLGNRILDMGCGNGINTAYLDKHGFNVIGIDKSKKMLKEARRLFPKVVFEEQDILATNFSNHSFDGIVLAYVINHFNSEGLNSLKKEIDRLLITNGLVFISAHIGNSEEIVKDPLDDTINIYYNFLSVESLDKLFFDYTREYYSVRPSYGEDEFLCDKMFIIYRKRA